MRLTILSSGSGDQPPRQPLIAYRIEDSVAIDAGCLTSLSVQEQRAISHVFLSHSHLDHIATLPLWVDTVWDPHRPALVAYALPATLDALRRHIFNGAIWPDITRPMENAPAMLELRPLREGEAVMAGPLTLLALPLSHVVPTCGFLIRDPAGASVAIISDTGPHPEVWQRLDQELDLRGVLVDVSFPEALADIASCSHHYTPQLLAAELRALRSRPRIVAVHLKPRYRDQVVAELQSCGIERLEVGVPGETLEF